MSYIKTGLFAFFILTIIAGLFLTALSVVVGWGAIEINHSEGDVAEGRAILTFALVPFFTTLLASLGAVILGKRL